ncbi:ribulose-phosphate 3-epimerase [bacterium]
MDKKIKISASIICADWMNLKNDIVQLEEGNIDYLHYDVMDGFFCPDYCLGTHIINAVRQNTTLPSDFHIMVEEPSRMFNTFEPSGTKEDIFTIHYEACRNLHRDLVKIKQLGFRAGVALNPATPITSIEYIIEEVDVIKIMTVNPGYTGQKLVPQTLQKIKLLNKLREKEKMNFEISIDGNVNEQNIPKMIEAGSDILIAGSSGLFKKDVPLAKSIQDFRRYIQGGLHSECKVGN